MNFVPAIPLLLAILPVQSAVIEGGIEIPTYAEPCKRHSVGFNKCVQKTLQSLIPKIGKRGIPELDLESIDPLIIPEMVFNYESLPDIGGKLEISGTNATGISTMKITNVRSRIVERKMFSMDIDFEIRKMTILGKFIMNGRVGQFPVTGRGPYNITTGEIKGTWKLRGVPVLNERQEYIKIVFFGVRPSVNYFKIHADNVVNGNPKLSSIVIAFVNRFWQLLYHQSLPYFEKNFETLGKQVLNKIFLKIPFDQLFPV